MNDGVIQRIVCQYHVAPDVSFMMLIKEWYNLQGIIYADHLKLLVHGAVLSPAV
jgi:hypothetical protein